MLGRCVHQIDDDAVLLEVPHARLAGLDEIVDPELKTEAASEALDHAELALGGRSVDDAGNDGVVIPSVRTLQLVST